MTDGRDPHREGDRGELPVRGSRTRPTTLKDAAWAIVKDSKGMTDTGHAASVRWARALLNLDDPLEPHAPARRRTDSHLHEYTRDTNGIWYCGGCREVYVDPTPDGRFQHAEPGRLIAVDGVPRHPWRPIWNKHDPDRPCWTCGNPPDHRFPDGSPAYACIHPPVFPGDPEAEW